MSYSIYLYDPSQTTKGAPRTIADFDVILADLQDRHPGRSAKFQRFAGLLAERIRSGDEEVGAWRTDPVATAKELTSALWNLDLPAADPMRAMRHVVECATASGLAAYDDETGLGFLPDGRVVPAERQQEWEDARDALSDESLVQTRPQLRQKLEARLVRILGGKGFSIDKAVAKEYGADVGLRRAIDGGVQYLSVKIEGASPSFRSSILFVGYLDPVTELFRQVLTEPLPLFGKTFGFELRELAADFETSRLWLEPDAKLDTTLGLLVHKALPLLDAASDLRGADWLLNDPASPMRLHMKRWYTVASLAVAFLAGNPRLDALGAELVESSKDRVDGTPAHLQALLAHIRRSR